MFFSGIKYKYNIQFYFTGTQYLIISVHEAAKILIFERNNTLYQSVILNKKRIFVKSDRRNGWTIIESVFCFYSATEIANFNNRGMKDNITLIFCLCMFLVQPMLYQLT